LCGAYSRRAPPDVRAHGHDSDSAPLRRKRIGAEGKGHVDRQMV